MLIQDQNIEVTWNAFIKNYYVEKGYNYTKMGDIFLVSLKDLLKSSHSKVRVICDYCGIEFEKTYKDYNSQHDNGDCCKHCQGKKALYVGEKRYGENYRGRILKNIAIERYGVDNVAKNEIIKDKIKQTNINKYGVSSALCKDYKNKKYPDSWNTLSRQKREYTNILKYGCKYPLSSPLIREKINKSYYNNGTQKTSSQQLEIFKILKNEYSICELNYPVSNCSLDCMIEVNNIKIDIEYDGEYWHQDIQKDRKRDEFIKTNNYKILRIKGKHNIPSKEQLIDSINTLIMTDKQYLEIKLT